MYRISPISSTLLSCLHTGIVYFTFVLLMFFFISGATVSAVFQPCRTCHMLFVLHARCVLYVSWQINDDDDDCVDCQGRRSRLYVPRRTHTSRLQSAVRSPSLSSQDAARMLPPLNAKSSAPRNISARSAPVASAPVTPVLAGSAAAWRAVDQAARTPAVR